jgi:hypothetical protein
LLAIAPMLHVLGLHILPCFQSLLPERSVCNPLVSVAVCAHLVSSPALTWWPPALCLLGLVAVRVLARYRIRVLDLLCWRHCEGSARIRGFGGGEEVQSSLADGS